MSDENTGQVVPDGMNRRGFLHCLAWAGHSSGAVRHMYEFAHPRASEAGDPVPALAQ